MHIIKNQVLKTRPKQVLGYLPLAFALPVAAKVAKSSTVTVAITGLLAIKTSQPHLEMVVFFVPDE